MLTAPTRCPQCGQNEHPCNMVAPWDGAHPHEDICVECFDNMANRMTPAEKIAKRILVLEGFGLRRSLDFWSSEKETWVRISRDDVVAALARVTATCATTNEDWLSDKIWDISRKGMLWFMDYLDQENLDRLLDPTVDLFPSAGI